GPACAQLALEVGDQLAAATGLGGVELVADEGEDLQLVEEVEPGQGVRQAARLLDLDQEAGFGGDEFKGRPARRFLFAGDAAVGKGRRGEGRQTDQGAR